VAKCITMREFRKPPSAASTLSESHLDFGRWLVILRTTGRFFGHCLELY